MNMKTCLICGKEIKEENGFLDDAGKLKIDFTFGSKFDSDRYKGYIHDSCFEKIKERTEFIGAKF